MAGPFIRYVDALNHRVDRLVMYFFSVRGAALLASTLSRLVLVPSARKGSYFVNAEKWKAAPVHRRQLFRLAMGTSRYYRQHQRPCSAKVVKIIKEYSDFINKAGALYHYG